MLKRTIASVVLSMAICGVTPSFAQTTAPSQAQAASTRQTEVPVKAVVLFSSGVGYFEHFGNVAGDAQTELRFKTGQINDILKSLVLQDLDRGLVSAITYPSLDPIAKTLRSFQVDITNNPPLADLLNQLRGAKVQVQVQAEKLSGTVLGVEKKRKPADKGEPVEGAVLNLLTGAMIRTIELDTITSLTLEDQQLQEELTRALTALSQARDQDKKPVTIDFRGQGDRRVRIGYVVETPIWKTSYRLILGDEKKTPTTGPATAPAADGKLQGWAIVENQTDSDWSNVQLSLVSGRPISFVMDLYQPLYIARPVVQQELYASLRPQMYDAGMDAAKEAQAFRQSGRGGRGGGGGGGMGGNMGGLGGAEARARGLAEPSAQSANAPAALKAEDLALSDVTASVQSVASAARMGELFQYTVGNVSLPRQKSAMLPIITDDIEVERLSIYNASVLPKNPLNGARLKNTTDKHLLQGPITVLDGSSYAGDAQIDNLPPGQERLLSYGIDLQVLVDATKNKHDNSILTGKIVKGVLEISRKHVSTQDYTADNKSDRAKTLIIEHPIRQGWKLVDTQTPIETTQAIYRFRGTVDAGKASKLTVKEEIIQAEHLAILPADIGQLLLYSRTGQIPQNVRDSLARAIQLKQAMVDTERQINERNQQVGEITQEQNRIRENMRTIQPNSQYYTRLLAKLNEQESVIEKLQTERDEMTKRRDEQRKELETYLAELNVG